MDRQKLIEDTIEIGEINKGGKVFEKGKLGVDIIHVSTIFLLQCHASAPRAKSTNWP